MELIFLHLYFKINLQVYVQNNIEISMQLCLKSYEFYLVFDVRTE
jgi:hypothetical protein